MPILTDFWRKIMNRKLRLLATILLLVVAFSSCTNETIIDEQTKDFVCNTSNILIHSTASNSFSFNVALFSKERIKKVEFIGFEGESIDNDNFNVNIIDNNIEVLDDYEYKGYHIKYVMIEITNNSSAEICNFDTLLLNVDGIRRTLSFDTPINHTFQEGNVFTDKLQISVIPNEFPSDFINSETQSATYEFYATEDVILQQVRFEDFLTPCNIIYGINDDEAQTAEFPIYVNKGDKLRISFSIMSELANSSSYLTTNIYFDYLSKTDNTNYYNSAIVIYDPVYPLKDNDTSNIDNLIDSLIKQ